MKEFYKDKLKEICINKNKLVYMITIIIILMSYNYLFPKIS